MLTYQMESLSIILPNVKELLLEHYEELTLNKAKIKLKPVWVRYETMEKFNQFYAITVRDDNVIVGYSGFIVQPHLHYEDVIVAQNDVLFLKKEYRLGTTGIRLLKYSEQCMKDLGANKITWHVKYSNDFRSILYRMGYLDEDVILGKMF